MVASGALLTGLVALLQSPSGAAVTGPTPVIPPGVDGGAYGANGNIALFGGPVNNFGPTGPAPVIALPPGGTVTASGASVVYGPATFIRTGQVTVSSNRLANSVVSSTSFLPTTGQSATPCLFSYPASFTAGSATVTSATASFTAADVGRVVSNANLPVDANGEQHTTILSVSSPTTATLAEPAATSATGSFLSIDRGVGSCVLVSQFTADTAASMCTATASGITASTTFTNGQLITLTDNSQYPTVVVPIPDNPPPNLTIDGLFYLNGAPEPFTYIFNEQITNPTTGALTVYAVHLIAKPDLSGAGGGQAIGDVYLGAAKCAPFVQVTTTTLPATTTTLPATTTTLPATTTTLPATTTTLPATTTTLPATTTTLPATTTTLPATTTTLPATTTTISANTCRAQLLANRAQVNAQIDAARASIIESVPPGSQRDSYLAQLEASRTAANNQIDTALARCPA